jgi:hypothetical protein
VRVCGCVYVCVMCVGVGVCMWVCVGVGVCVGVCVWVGGCVVCVLESFAIFKAQLVLFCLEGNRRSVILRESIALLFVPLNATIVFS